MLLTLLPRDDVFSPNLPHTLTLLKILLKYLRNKVTKKKKINKVPNGDLFPFHSEQDLPDRHTGFENAMGQPCVYLLNGAMKSTKGILEGEPVHAGPDADRGTLTLLKSVVWSEEPLSGTCSFTWEIGKVIRAPVVLF